MKLPKLIEAYVRSQNENNREDFVACFSENATVLDEGKTLMGREAIGRWFSESKKKYNQVTEPISLKENKDDLVLTAKVSGTFPGSPINLNFHFKVKANRIQDLRVD